MVGAGRWLLEQLSDEPVGRVWGGLAGSPSKRGGRDLAPFPLSDFRRLIPPRPTSSFQDLSSEKKVQKLFT